MKECTSVISLPSTSKPATFRTLVFLPSSAYLCCLQMVDIISTAHTLMVSHPFTIRPDFLTLFQLKIKSSSHKASPCLRPFWTGNTLINMCCTFVGVLTFNIVLVEPNFIPINFLDSPWKDNWGHCNTLSFMSSVVWFVKIYKWTMLTACYLLVYPIVGDLEAATDKQIFL